MKNSKYKFVKFLFGLFIILFGVRTFLELEENKSLMTKYIAKYEVDINHHLNTLKTYILENYSEAEKMSFMKHSVSLEKFKEYSEEFIILSSCLSIIGGLLTIYGYSISGAFILSSFLIEFIFLHNYYYFKEEKMKVNVLKLIAVFGGLMHLE